MWQIVRNCPTSSSIAALIVSHSPRLRANEVSIWLNGWTAFQLHSRQQQLRCIKKTCQNRTHNGHRLDATSCVSICVAELTWPLGACPECPMAAYLHQLHVQRGALSKTVLQTGLSRSKFTQILVKR